MRQIGKKRQKTFNKKVEKLLLEIGAKIIKENYPSEGDKDFEIETIAGRLEIHLRQDHGSIFSIFTRFDNPKEAKELSIDCNPYSGKWNFHLSDENDLLDVFQTNIVGILPKKTVDKFEDLEEGKEYYLTSNQFNATNKVKLISKDFTGLNRGIVYFQFSERVERTISKEDLIKNFQENRMTPHVFAFWDFNMSDHLIVKA